MPVVVNALDVGAAVTLFISIIVAWRAWVSPAFRAATRTPSVQDLKAQLENCQAVIEAITEQNTALRNRLQTMEINRVGLEVTLARLQGELGRLPNK